MKNWLSLKKKKRIGKGKKICHKYNNLEQCVLVYNLHTFSRLCFTDIVRKKDIFYQVYFKEFFYIHCSIHESSPMHWSAQKEKEQKNIVMDDQKKNIQLFSYG